MLAREYHSVFVPFEDHGLAIMIPFPERSSDTLPATGGSKKKALRILVFLFEEIIDFTNQAGPASRFDDAILALDHDLKS